jgi:hypothetical protein
MKSKLSHIIRELKPKAALLTTYTLSLSFFESAILSEFKKVGCQDVVLLVDAQESQKSLSEARSMGAGRTYRFLPVASPGGGFFHPKIAYLECKDDDVLVISSGNLTFSGQGGNLECIDQVLCSEHPEVFHEFADWCQIIGEKLSSDFSMAAMQLDAFGRRARAQAKKHQKGAQRTAWLVHNAAESATTQFERIANELGQWESLCVLSPFHSEDAAPVVELSDRLKAQFIEIGLDPSTLNAAINRKLFKPKVPVFFVIPNDDGNLPRDLHAKWFELRAPGKVLAMTGSTNATHQSFETLANVEISLVRALPKSPINWIRAEPAGFIANKFSPPLVNNTLITFDCALNQKSRIQIQLHQKVSKDNLEVVVQCSDKILYKWATLNISETGEVITPVINLSKAVYAISVQLRCGDLLGVSWLNIESELEGGDLDGGHNEAFARLAGGQSLPGDSYVFLQLFVQFSGGNTSRRNSGNNQTDDKTVENQSSNDEVDFSYRSWTDSGKSRGAVGRPFAADKLAHALSRIFSLNKRDLDITASQKKLGHSSSTKEYSNDENDWNSEENDFEERESALRSQLRSEIPTFLNKNPGHAHSYLLASYLLAEALSYSREMALHVNVDQAYSACQRWLENCGELNFSDSTREALMPLAVVLGSWIILQYGLKKQLAPVENILNSIKKIGGGIPSADNFSNFALLGLEHPLMGWIDQKNRDQIITLIPSFTTSKPLDELLVNFLQLGPTVVNNAKLMALFPGLSEALNAKKSQRKVPYGIIRGTLKEKSPCPCCFVSLSLDSVKHLRRYLFSVCPSPTCKQIILNIQNPALISVLAQGVHYG